MLKVDDESSSTNIINAIVNCGDDNDFNIEDLLQQSNVRQSDASF